MPKRPASASKKQKEGTSRRRKTEEEVERLRADRAIGRRMHMQRTRKNQPRTASRINLLLNEIQKLPRK